MFVDKGIKMSREPGAERNPWKAVFIGVAGLAFLYFVTGITALLFPDLGIPFVMMSFPLGPQPPPVPVQ